jgi:WD40 repeat protein
VTLSRRKQLLIVATVALLIGGAAGWVVPVPWLASPRPRAVLPALAFNIPDEDFLFAPTGSLIATVSLQLTSYRWMHCLQLWDSTTGNRRATLYLDPRPITKVEFSTDGRQIAATVLPARDVPPELLSAGPLPEPIRKCWDVESGTEAIVKPASFSAFNPVADPPQNAPPQALAIRRRGAIINHAFHDWAYAPSAGKLVWRESRTYGGGVWVWDASTDGSRQLIPEEMGLAELSISADGRQIAAWRLRESVRVWPPLANALARLGMAPPVRYTAEICIFDARDGSEVACLPTLNRNKLSPDGNSFAAISPNGEVAIYDVPFRKPYGQRITIGFAVGIVVFLFVNLMQSSTFHAARRLLWHLVVQRLFKARRGDQTTVA